MNEENNRDHTQLSDHFKEQLEVLSRETILNPRYRRKKLLLWLIRNILLAALYVIFWEYSWVRWTLILTIPFSLVSLFLIAGMPFLLQRKIRSTEQKITEAEILRNNTIIIQEETIDIPEERTTDQEEDDPEEEDEEIVFLSISQGNQDALIYAPPHGLSWLQDMDNKYDTGDPERYRHLFYEYTENLFDTLPEIARESDIAGTFFDNLSHGQKLFYCLLVFTGEVDNGGVVQFFFNRPGFCFAIAETFSFLGMDQLKTDYAKCLEEFIGTSETYGKRQETFNNENLEWAVRWNAFKTGYNDIPSAEIISSYFYTDEFKEAYYKTFIQYVKANPAQFVTI